MAKKPAQTFGQVALERKFLTIEELGEGLRLQKKLRDLGLRESLGEILVKKGSLTQDQVREILKVQGKRTRTQIPGYEILEKLGAGGMGSVFKAKQISMDRPVAIKILSEEMASKEEARGRFLREGKMAARLNHPNIVSAYDVGRHDSIYFLVMEFVDGPTLQDQLRLEGALGEEESLRYWLQIAGALSHAAAHGMIHRDVKPGNIMIDPLGRAKLADLGLARPIEPGDAEITMPGTTIGTPWYISPEQAQGMRDLDIRTDIYSLGASFYHVLTGKPPFEGPSAGAILTAHLMDPPEPPHLLRSDITNRTCRVLLRSLEKDREDRHATTEELVRDLEEAIRELHSPARHATPATPPKAPPRLPRRRRSRIASRYHTRRQSNTAMWFILSLLAGLFAAALIVALFI